MKIRNITIFTLTVALVIACTNETFLIRLPKKNKTIYDPDKCSLLKQSCDLLDYEEIVSANGEIIGCICNDRRPYPECKYIPEEFKRVCVCKKTDNNCERMDEVCKLGTKVCNQENTLYTCKCDQSPVAGKGIEIHRKKPN